VFAPTWVGVKVTAIWQLFPAAKVLPQGVLPAAELKAPLVAMLVMSSVTLPPLVSVTVFAVLVSPTTSLLNKREDGDRLTPVASGFTVRLNDAVLVTLPDTPVMVIVVVPKVAEPLAVRVSVLVEVVGFGTNPADTPFGRPEADSVTLPSKPPA